MSEYRTGKASNVKSASRPSRIPNLDSIGFSEEQVNTLTARLKDWASSHNSPNQTVFRLDGGRGLTPTQMANAVRNGDDEGLRVLRALSQSLKWVTFEEILANYPTSRRS